MTILDHFQGFVEGLCAGGSANWTPQQNGKVKMDIVWDGPGVWTMNQSELGAVFLNQGLVCVCGDNVTIFTDVLDAQIAPDPPVSGQSLPNSSPIVLCLVTFWDWTAPVEEHFSQTAAMFTAWTDRNGT